MKKRIQIPVTLFEMMVGYIRDHYDPSDRQRYISILKGVEEKRDAEIRHNMYTAYKIQSDPETREALRASYLDKAGIPSHGRWEREAEEHFKEGDFTF